jgi:hypothetical protein
MKFTLISARRYYADMSWGGEDYVVLDRKGQLVGRIILHAQRPKDRRWLWAITAPKQPPSVHNQGYSATREHAMADFNAQWVALAIGLQYHP